MKTPKLIKIDLSKCCPRKWEDGDHWHPDIKLRNQYLAKIGGSYFAGQFSLEWYGWNFVDWCGCGLQLDKPGTNSSEWQGLWRIS